MISAPRSVVVSVIFFPMGLFYYSSANGADYPISARNPTAASAMKGYLTKELSEWPLVANNDPFPPLNFLLLSS